MTASWEDLPYFALPPAWMKEHCDPLDPAHFHRVEKDAPKNAGCLLWQGSTSRRLRRAVGATASGSCGSDRRSEEGREEDGPRAHTPVGAGAPL